MNNSIAAVEGLWLAQQMKYSLWLYPTVETLHLWGIGSLFGAIVLVDLRILGLGRGLELSRLVAFAVPVAIAGFGLAALTGLMMFLTHASEFIASTLFVLKMVMLMLLFLNAVSVHIRLRPPLKEAGLGVARLSPSLKLQALASIFGWALVIGFGRWLAYV